MPDIIKLLPDNIANQIAAGEVIQRPASVVKELLENAVDAKSSEIKLIIKDSGKTLIQVIDNGSGMSATDARMAFERHATSKISTANELFSIRTKGFRGEALASIAAIAHVELLTRKYPDDLGIRLLIHGSKIEKQEVVQTALGSNFSVKNLFYNVPARRKFLKSDPVELRHILDEFHRVALAHPDIHFSFVHNGNEVYHLPPASLKQRIVGIFGKTMDAKLLPIAETTDVIKIDGFIGKADAAKKNNSEQFLFVNQRFIRSNYLAHAIKTGYDLLLQKDQYPSFFIFMEVDPSSIDVNVHPTKTEVKFDEEPLIYNYLRVSVKHALGKYVVAPTLDFETDTNFISNHSKRENVPASYAHPSYESDATKLQRENLKSWDKIYDNIGNQAPLLPKQESMSFDTDSDHQQSKGRDPYQIHQQYILSHIKSGYILIDQHLAHQRIMYERNLKAITDQPMPVQKELFPIQLEFSAARAEIVSSLLPYLNKIGFEIAEFGQYGFVVHGTPAGMSNSTGIDLLMDKLIHQFEDQLELQLGIEENLARSFAKVAALQRGKLLTLEEMNNIIHDLFACETPFTSPYGKKTFVTVYLEDLAKQFNK